ncbi:unnamed protein product [Schistosoma curassoni]|nr:unnamed protein product [Schistosoma curassoni]
MKMVCKVFFIIIKNEKVNESMQCTNDSFVDFITLTLEQMENFTYLVSIIDEIRGSDAHVKVSIGKVSTAFLQLKNIWNTKQLSVDQHYSQNLQYENQDSSTVRS